MSPLVKDEYGQQKWVCPECGVSSYILIGARWRWHRAECSWLYGLDARPDGSYNQDAVVESAQQDYE